MTLNRIYIVGSLIICSRSAQHAARGLLAIRGKLGCGPPHPAQNVLIFAQKWLLCVGNATMLHFSILQLKVGFK